MSEDPKFVLRKLIEYWIRNPEAKDTLDGICRWWLPDETAEYGRERIQQALDYLVSREWVSFREITPAQKIYGVNRERMDEMDDFLGEKRESF